jgi:hypothetical protein
MKILIECGLVAVEAVGRERFCRAKLDGLKEVHSWTEQYRIFWTKKLDALGVFLDNENQAPTKRKKRSKKNPLKK